MKNGGEQLPMVVHNDMNAVTYDAGVHRCVGSFGDIVGQKVITLQAGVQLDYLAIIYDGSNVQISIKHIGEGAVSRVTFVCVGTRDAHITLDGSSVLDASHTSSEVSMLSFVCEGATLAIDGGVHICPGIVKGAGHLHERNIMLAHECGSVASLPRLDVRSNDVEASHGATIDRLSTEGLFYLTSKGISYDTAVGLMISGAIHMAVDGFEQNNTSVLHDTILEAVL